MGWLVDWMTWSLLFDRLIDWLIDWCIALVVTWACTIPSNAAFVRVPDVPVPFSAPSPCWHGTSARPGWASRSSPDCFCEIPGNPSHAPWPPPNIPEDFLEKKKEKIEKKKKWSKTRRAKREEEEKKRKKKGKEEEKSPTWWCWRSFRSCSAFFSFSNRSVVRESRRLCFFTFLKRAGFNAVCIVVSFLYESHTSFRSCRWKPSRRRALNSISARRRMSSWRFPGISRSNSCSRLPILSSTLWKMAQRMAVEAGKRRHSQTQSINQSIEALINQSINQSVNQPWQPLTSRDSITAISENFAGYSLHVLPFLGDNERI